MTQYSNDAKYVAKLQLIEKQIADKQLGLAAQGLNALIKGNPQDPRLFLLGSAMSLAAGNRKGELELAQRAYQVAPEWSIASLHLAKVLASRGLATEALALAEQAVLQTGKAADSVDLLMQAVVVANQFGDNAKALRWLRQADEIKPDDLPIRYKMAVVLMRSGEYASAIDILDQQLLLHPQTTALLSARLSAFFATRQMEKALADAQALVALEPDNQEFQFYLSFALGESPSAMPESLMGQLFGDYASKFDQQLVVQLGYTLPRDVALMIHAWHPDKKVDVLDLGCGTGLLGACLGPMEGVLVGVDLSLEMINQARRHQVYTRFHQVNLIDALRATPADQYHVITALDVLIYIGDLEPVMPAAFQVLLPGGRFVFSCELGADDSKDFTLHNTMRFTHRPAYVEKLLETSGFTDITVNQRVIRREWGEPISGLLVTACKPLQVSQKTAPKSPKNARKGRSGL